MSGPCSAHQRYDPDCPQCQGGLLAKPLHQMNLPELRQEMAYRSRPSMTKGNSHGGLIG